MRKTDHFSDVCWHADTCALAGAAAFFAGIPDAAIVVNGPMWCYFYAMRHLEDSQPLLSQRMVCTQLDNEAIVFGTEEYLRDTLAPYVEKPPALLCIESNCSASLIGDDMAGIAREMGIACPVVVFDSGGLIGGFAEGYAKAAAEVLDVLSPPPMPDTSWRRVNLLGLTPGYCNGMNDQRELERLLRLAGYEVNACPGGGTEAAGLFRLTHAALNIVVHEELGRPLAERMEKEYRIPFIAPRLPYGVAGTRAWLEAVGAALPGKKLDVALSACDEERDRLFRFLNAFKMVWGELWFEEAVVAAPPSTAFGLVAALRGEWADMGRLTAIVQQPRFGAIAPDMGDLVDAVCPAEDAGQVEMVLGRLSSGLLLGSSSENQLLRRAGRKDVQFFSVANPVEEHVRLTDLPFMGLRGAGYVQECLWNDAVRQMIRDGRKEKL